MAHQTGIAEFDRKFGGRISPGTLVAVKAPPRAQREPLLCAGAEKRATKYFTTIRSEGTIEKQSERAPMDAAVESISEIHPEGVTDTIPEELSDLGNGQDFIIDVVDPIEASVDQQTSTAFLNDLTERLRDSDSVGYFHGYASDKISTQRQVTLDIADFVWRLVPVTSRGEINYMLEIPKTNGLNHPAKDRYLEISIGTGVDIDQAKNIG